MKHFLLTLLIAIAASSFSNAQTLQIDPLYIGGTATFEVQNGTPNTTAVICYSLNGSGPFTLSNGITLDLSLPINSLTPFGLDAQGNGTLGPFPLPASAVVGMQVWFQGVQLDMWANPIYTVTNMVPITVDAPPPPVDMVAIPGGTFEMGDHAGVGYIDEQPVHSVTLDAFFMDKYEVSNTRFADFLNNSPTTVIGSDVYQVGGAVERICYLVDGLNHVGGTFGIDAGKDNHPVVNVTWYGAALYCNYLSTLNGGTPCYDETTFACDFTADGFRLPTEAEWEYASRGGEHSPYYQYPWGSDTISYADANYDYTANIGTTVDVGNYAANGYGLYDMAGNAWEWCNDWYGSYSNSPSTNPTGPASGSYRVLRGGGWTYPALYLRCAIRYADSPTYYYSGFGFRVLAAQ
jgi:formylglycine-generating enzyme required for sulfatase activity